MNALLFPGSCDCRECHVCDVGFAARDSDNGRCPECDADADTDVETCADICVDADADTYQLLDEWLEGLAGDTLVAVRYGAGTTVPEDTYTVLPDGPLADRIGRLGRGGLTVEVAERSAELRGSSYDEIRSVDAAYELLAGSSKVPHDELLHICAAAAGAGVDLAGAVAEAEQTTPQLARGPGWLPALAALSLGDPAAAEALRRLGDPEVARDLREPVEVLLQVLRPVSSPPTLERVSVLLAHDPAVVLSLCGEHDHRRLVAAYRLLRSQPKGHCLLDPQYLSAAAGAHREIVEAVRAVADQPALAAPAAAAIWTLTSGDGWGHTPADLTRAVTAARAII